VFAKTKGIVIVACVSFCTLTLLGGRPNVPPRPASGADSSAEAGAVLVEAFVVEVNLPALAEQGVSPIGRAPHAVSVADLLECLDRGQAQVIGGAKAASGSREATSVRTEETVYVIRQTGTPGRTTRTPYQSGSVFSVTVGSISEAMVTVRFDLTYDRFTEKAQSSDVPPDTESWDWSGSAFLDPGVPQIAAATQDSETAVFLLLTAHHQGQ